MSDISSSNLAFLFRLLKRKRVENLLRHRVRLQVECSVQTDKDTEYLKILFFGYKN